MDDSASQVRQRLSERSRDCLLAFLFFLIVLLIVRLGTFSLPPTWDAAMTVWPAAIETTRQGSAVGVMELPTYAEGGPNTHTLSVMTQSIAVVVALTSVDVAIVLTHIVNVVMLAGIGAGVVFVLLRTGRLTAWLVGLATVVFPVMVGQSAYLYIDLPASFFGFLGLILVGNRRAALGALSVAVAIAVKPIAVVFLPAFVVLGIVTDNNLRRLLSSALLATLAVIPALLIPQGPIEISDWWDRVQRATSASWIFISGSPELLLLLALPLLFLLLHIRKGSSWQGRSWFLTSLTLVVSFLGFFVLNGLITPGYFMLPRYFVVLIPPLAVGLGESLGRLGARWVHWSLAIVIAAGIVGSRGPLALGSGSALQPIAERSLAFADLFESHRAGLNLLAELSTDIPVFYDRQAHYGVNYPEMRHLETPMFDGTPVFLEGTWGDDLDSLPDRFAMLVEYPWLGSGRMRLVASIVEQDAKFSVSRRLIGDAKSWPVELILVTRRDG